MIRKRSQYYERVIFYILVMACLSSVGWGASYYVDGKSGNDGNTGTQAAPWKSVAKVNGFSLKAGDFVYFKAEGVWDTLLYPVSGISGNPITYTSYGEGGSKPRIRGFNADGKAYIQVDNIEFKNGSYDYPAVLTNNTHHVSLKNCNIYSDTNSTTWTALMISNNSHHNEIYRCDIKHLNYSSQHDAVNLRRNADYNLLHENTIGNATHYGLSLEGSDAANPSYTCNYNIIKNNILNNNYGAQFGLASNSNRNVIERNTLIGGSGGAFSNNQTRSIKSVSMNNIIRRNIVRDNTDMYSSGISTEVYRYGSDPANIASGNHVYNNIITNISRYPLVFATDGSKGVGAYNNRYKNNIVYNNAFPYQLWIMNHETIYDNFFSNNIFYKSGTDPILNVGGNSVNVLTIQTTDPTHFWGNMQLDPMLDSGYKPLRDSPCIDAGDFLTRIVSNSGAGKTFVVVDSGYFTDGFGVVPGDRIKIGSSSVIITSIEYTTHSISVENAVSWNTNDPVSLPYSGSKPDIGVFEYESTDTVATPLNLFLIR